MIFLYFKEKNRMSWMKNQNQQHNCSFVFQRIYFPNKEKSISMKPVHCFNLVTLNAYVKLYGRILLPSTYNVHVIIQADYVDID